MDGHDQPTALERARNFRTGPTSGPATRAAQWRRWQSDAETIWKNNPSLSRHAVAELVKRRLQLSEQAGSIARRIIQPRESSKRLRLGI
jgi:hypothetical protein